MHLCIYAKTFTQGWQTHLHVFYLSQQTSFRSQAFFHNSCLFLLFKKQKKQNVISLNQHQDMLAKMAANGIQTRYIAFSIMDEIILQFQNV